MLTDFGISLFFGAGLGGWVYSKMIRRTGGEFKEAMIVSAGAGLVGVLFFFVLLKFFF